MRFILEANKDILLVKNDSSIVFNYLKGINFRGNKFSRFRDAKITNFKHFARSYFRERAKLKRFRENLFSRMENIENEVFITNLEKPKCPAEREGVYYLP